MSADDIGLVYFVLDATRLEQRVKIGFTTNLGLRLSSLAAQTLTKQEPLLIALEGGGRRREYELHEEFRSLRRYGEWFDYTGELKAYIAELPNPQGWIQDRPDLWQYAHGVLGVPDFKWWQTAPIDPRLDENDDPTQVAPYDPDAKPIVF